MEFPKIEVLNCKNPYIIFEIDKYASQEEIKKKYRSLAIKWHPDKNPINSNDCAQMFIKVKWAYDILSNSGKRNQYDKFGIVDGEEEHLEDILQKFNEEFKEDLSPLRSKNFSKAFKDSKNFAEMKKLCPECNGYGIIEVAYGFFIKKESCQKCNGNGYVDPPLPREPDPTPPHYRYRPC